MDGTRRVRAIWSWLPAFRAVAEMQHVHDAAKQLSISPSALSRSIRLLEDQVGQPLFDRVGRTLRLNPMGERFLSAVRDGIRRVDDGLDALEAREMSGRLAVMTRSPFTDLLLFPALKTVVDKHPLLQPFVERGGLSEGIARLSRGELDVVLHDQPVQSARLDAELLWTSSCSVYCGPGHELFGKRESLPALAMRPFCVVASRSSGMPVDGWPAELPRARGVRVDGLGLAAAACASGDMVAVLPDALARQGAGRTALWPIAAAPARWPIYFVRRSRLISGDRTDVMIDALREAAVRLEDGARRHRGTTKRRADPT